MLSLGLTNVFLLVTLQVKLFHNDHSK
jgi:hypothetical protein